MDSHNNVHPNVHPETKKQKPAEAAHSDVLHPPPEDDPTRKPQKSFPDTGWRGPIPSQKGGSYEEGFMHKPPYEWKSDGDLFKPKYHSYVDHPSRSSILRLTHTRSECWCGNVAFEFHGDPVDAKHCHCKQCQHLHGAPFQWAVIFPKVRAPAGCVRTADR